MAVVIPALNEEEMVGLAIASARSAGASEIIVADGGSTDRTPDVARDAGALVIESPNVRGCQANAGAAASTSPILLFLHADTELPADAVDAIHDAVASFCGGGKRPGSTFQDTYAPRGSDEPDGEA